METITFKELLFKTAFCCMASDGNIDKKEVQLIKKMCQQSPLFSDFDFGKEINILFEEINNLGSLFIHNYFDQLNNTEISEKEELIIIDFAIKTIKADNVIEYSEIKFFKVIRKCLTVSDESILAIFPDLDIFLEEDIDIENKIDKLVHNYLKSVELPQFAQINLEHLDN